MLHIFMCNIQRELSVPDWVGVWDNSYPPRATPHFLWRILGTAWKYQDPNKNLLAQAGIPNMSVLHSLGHVGPIPEDVLHRNPCL